MANEIKVRTPKILLDGERMLGSDKADDYERLYTLVHEMEGLARETFQYQFRQDYERVVEKLSKDEPLSEADKTLLSQLVIADAKSYVKHAKEFESWKDQISRLLAELRQINGQATQTTDDLLKIQAICRDLRAVLPDITFYLRERERVQTYEQVDLQALPPDMKRLLAEVIDQMMRSDKM